MPPLEKSYPTFDCDSHVTELPEIWDYLSEKEKEIVRPCFWPNGPWVILNGNTLTHGYWDYGHVGYLLGGDTTLRRGPSAVESTGPGVNKLLIRKLREMRLTEEQCEYTDHKGARDPRSRLVEMDQQGIDQVMVIPLMMMQAFLYVENAFAASLVARAYNDWIYDWCSVDRERLYPCAALPSQNPVLAAEEVRRVATRGFKIVGLRAALIHGLYPNQPIFEPLWQALEETGIVAGMHSLPQQDPDRIQSFGTASRPPSILDRAIGSRQIQGGGQTLGFAHMAMTWMANALLSGFFERHPGLTRMAIMESNASWLPMLLEECDRAFDLYKGVRNPRVSRRPSEVFFERCFIAFEGDETPVYKQYPYFEDVGIWSSDVYHHDGADAWSAIRDMEQTGVPIEAQAKLMGGNARRMYGIEPRMVTTMEPEAYPRPDWYPKMEDVEKEYAHLLRT